MIALNEVHGGEFDLVYLGGQSNMEGFGFVKELPEDLQPGVEGCFIFHATAKPDLQPVSGQSKWVPLKPGHGTDFQANENEVKYSNRFGVELSLAAELRKQRPDRKLAIIKYARNGSSIDVKAAGNWGSWEPDFEGPEGDYQGINQYDHFLSTVQNGLTNADVDGDGEVDKLHPIGICWMQGESDAVFTEEIANGYQKNLKRLMELIRAAFRKDDLPVAIGRISDSRQDASGKVWKHGEIVREAQKGFVEQDRAARLITTTDQYQYSDKWHYDSQGYIDLGKQFASAIAELNR